MSPRVFVLRAAAAIGMALAFSMTVRFRRTTFVTKAIFLASSDSIGG
jgi:hypothetical protein